MKIIYFFTEERMGLVRRLTALVPKDLETAKKIVYWVYILSFPGNLATSDKELDLICKECEIDKQDLSYYYDRIKHFGKTYE